MRVRRRRASRFPRLELRRPTASPIAGQVWTRSSLVRDREKGGVRAWRTLAVMVAVLEACVMAWLVAGPAFQIQHVDVSGAHHLKPAQIVAMSGLQRTGSVFAVDATSIRRRLTGTPWVRTADVWTQLPDRVLVRVEEWVPVATYRAGPNTGSVYISDQAVVLGSAAPAGDPLVEIVGPSQPEARVGHPVMDVQLLTALVNIQRAFPGQYGQEVAAYGLDCSGNLTLGTKKGWKIYFGRVLTPDEFASLRLKLAALKAVQSREDFNSLDLEYVNLMDASAPAVKHRSSGPAAPPASPQPATTARPAGVQVLPCR